MNRYYGILYVLNHDLKHWKRKYEEATNDVDAEVADNALEKISVNIEIFKKAETLDRMLEIFNDATKPTHVAEEEIFEILRSEWE